MKKLIFAICILSLTPLFADLLVVEDMEQTGPATMKMEIPMKFKGDKVRMDMGKQGGTILDMQSGDLTVLMPQQKSYMTMAGDSIKAMAQQMQAAQAGGSPKVELPKSTGRKENVNGFDAEEYVMNNSGGMQVSLWLAKNVPNQELLLQQFKKMSSLSAGKGGIPNLDYTSLPGFPVRTVITSPQTGKIVMNIKTIQELTLPDSDFQVPSDYKKITMPSFK